MKAKHFFCFIVAALFILALFVGILADIKIDSSSAEPNVFVGVDAAYDNVTSIKSLVDEIKSYTNFFVIGSTGITLNTTKADDVCQYLFDSGLYFSPYTHTTVDFNQTQWIIEAKQRWKSQFLGLYTYDEPGGHQIDHDVPFMLAPRANNYADATNKYVENLSLVLSEFKIYNLPLITSDYALFDYVYRAGYDSVFTEFVGNQSRTLSIALCRGAATMQSKDWGAIITYGVNASDLESGQMMYEDMVMAYQNGAKYILVFDYAKDKATGITHGILKQEHLDALKNFWTYVRNHPRPNVPVTQRVAYVLPENYGYGFRGPQDKIWGLWQADNLSSRVWNDFTTLAAQYKEDFDIIYVNDLQSNLSAYGKLVFWNGTTIT